MNTQLHFYLSEYHGNYKLFQMQNMDLVLKQILQIMLNESGNDFFYYTKTAEELSFIVSEQIFDKYFDQELRKYISHAYDYKIVSFDTSGLLERYGVLSKLAQCFEKHQISILCVSTYSNNLILYEKSQEKNFAEMLIGCKDIITMTGL